MADLPRELSMSIDLLLDLVEHGQLEPDALQLLQAAHTLKECANARAPGDASS